MTKPLATVLFGMMDLPELVFDVEKVGRAGAESIAVVMIPRLPDGRCGYGVGVAGAAGGGISTVSMRYTGRWWS